MISYPDLLLSMAISADASRSNRTSKAHQTRVVFAALILWISACSKTPNWNHLSSQNPEARPAPGRVSLDNQVPDLKLRDAAHAGDHPAPPDLPIPVHPRLTILNQHDVD